jgi:hypothetical protein
MVQNVSGLDISSPVRSRGVPIGRVSRIRIDPGVINIEIVFEVYKDRLQTFGVDGKRVEAIASLGVFERLRSEVVSNVSRQREGTVDHWISGLCRKAPSAPSNSADWRQVAGQFS